MSQFNSEQAFRIAIGHHQAGRLHEAEELYRQILAQQPEHADAMHCLGMIAHRLGRNDVAVDLIRRAINLGLNAAEAYSNLGNALTGKGQLDEAIAAYRQAILLKPDLPEACFNLGNALTEKGQFDEAIAVCRQAIALRPNSFEAHNNLGNAFLAKGQYEEAIAATRVAITLGPDAPQPYGILGNALKEKGRLGEAIVAYRQAIARNPNSPQNLSNLGVALTLKDKVDEAITVFRQAIALRPTYAPTYSFLGIALKTQGQFDEAIAAYSRAIDLDPNLVEAHSNLGNALKAKGHFDEAIAAYRRAIAISPDFADAHNNLANVLLLKGELLEGWDEYEWRSKCKDFTSPWANFAQPQWDGQPLEGRTLLLHAEQGFGDTMQFIRYVSLVAESDAQIILECQPELQRLIQSNAAGRRVAAKGPPLADFDLHCPLMTLPRVFRTTLQNIPAHVPYLQAIDKEVQIWRDRLAGDRRSLRVGLAWAGRPTHTNDRNRSIALAHLAPLARVPGIRFVSLQTGEAAAQARNAPKAMQLIDLRKDLKDFADTAALIANLDLIIAVDTAVVHLAGAMGKPVWVLVPFVPDWRWLLNRDDSPWYPTMRLFRQRKLGDWLGMIERVERALREQAPVPEEG